jgi:hypothetical protein
MYECLLDEEPTIEGMEELVTRKAVEKLEEAGVSRMGLRNYAIWSMPCSHRLTES